ncbi:family 2 glycosyl transferase [Nocardiopsis aegyptia]
MASPSPLPPGLGVEIDRAVRLADEGHVLVGGSPPRALRLTPSQLSSVIRWSSGAAPSGRAERLLARELIEEGLAHPRPLPPVPFRSVDVDVDVAVVGQAGARGLGRTLDRLAELHPELRPVVVGATGPCAWAARARGARIVPGPAGGPGARAAALRVCAAEFVALLESGSCPDPGWLDAALGHFADPGVAAVVPRVLTERPRAAGHWRLVVAAVAAEQAATARGADPAPVLPWGQGPGQPGAGNEHTASDPLRPLPALVLRRSALEGGSADRGVPDGSRPDASDGGRGLRPELGHGAELDLVWRLASRGRGVRYEPRARVRSRPVTDLGGYLRACFTTGAQAAPLARLHGRRAAGPELSPEGAVGLARPASDRPGDRCGAGAAAPGLLAGGPGCGTGRAPDVDGPGHGGGRRAFGGNVVGRGADGVGGAADPAPAGTGASASRGGGAAGGAGRGALQGADGVTALGRRLTSVRRGEGRGAKRCRARGWRGTRTPEPRRGQK